jgi:hypothetical protein
MRTHVLGSWRRLSVAVVVLALAVAGCKSAPDEGKKRVEPAGPHASVLKLFPSVGDVTDWKAVGGAKIFGPAADAAENIEPLEVDLAAGAAPFRNYGYLKSATRKYARGQGGESVTVRVFEMKNSGEAFGVFSVASSGTPVKDLNKVLAAKMSGTALGFAKGPFYVTVDYSGTNAADKVLTEFGGWIAGEIGQEGNLPSVFRTFPIGSEEGQMYFLHTFAALKSLSFFPKGDAARLEQVLKLTPETDVAIVGYPTSRPGVLNYVFAIYYPKEADAVSQCEQYYKYLLGTTNAAEKNVAINQTPIFRYIVGTLNAEENAAGGPANDILMKLIQTLKS